MIGKKRKRFHRVGLNFHTIIDLVAIILIWRGAWNIIDTYLFPEHAVFSALLGIIVGLIILVMDDFKLKELP